MGNEVLHVYGDIHYLGNYTPECNLQISTYEFFATNDMPQRRQKDKRDA